MASQVKNGGTFADDSAVGTVAWSNPSNAQTSNDVRAEAALTEINTVSHYLKVTNFGFAIPTGATINGVLARIERSASDSISGDIGAIDNIVKLVKGGVVSGNNKAVSTLYPTNDTYQSYGGSTDLWGLTLTKSDVEATTFGIVISSKLIFGSFDVTVWIDHIELTVYYTEQGTTYYQTCTATLTTSGAIVKTSKPVKAGTLISSGALAKIQTFTKTLTATLTLTAVLIRKAIKELHSSYSTAKGTTTGTNDATIGNISWTGTGNTAANDGTEASVVLDPSGGG